MRTLESILVEHPFFKGLQPQYLQLITGCASNVRFNAGTYMLREGEQASQFYLIRHGKVVGWSWLFPPYRWHFSARVVEPVRAIALDGICLRAKGEEDHDLGYELMKRVAQIMMERLQATRIQLLDVYGVGARGG